MNIRVLGIAGGVATLLVLERLFPLRRQTHPAGPRFALNAVISAVTYLVATFCMVPPIQATIDWAARSQFGVSHWLGLGRGGELIVGLLVLDLTFYFWHRANHKVAWLWRFHNVHHFDPDMDLSTGFRFHFFEILLSTPFRMAQVAIAGVSLPTFLVFETTFQMAVFFHHSNLRLPLKADAWVNWLFVTPRQHTVHHSRRVVEADTNYGSVFSFWDRLFGSFKGGTDPMRIGIGVPGYSAESDNTLLHSLLAPFIRQKKYWE